MTISEMHVWFRQYAQQMGMQNVRAILPEQIDLLINTSITDILNQLIKENIGITNDRVITDNSKIGQINAFRSLYRVSLIDMCPVNGSQRCFKFDAANRNNGKMSSAECTGKLPDFMYLVDFSINYKKATKGYYPGKSITTQETLPDETLPAETVEVGPRLVGETPGIQEQEELYDAPSFLSNDIETNFFPVRVIDDAFLADTLNDFVLKNRLRSPIIVTYNNNGSKSVFDIYIDKFKEVVDNSDPIRKKRYFLENNLLPYQLRMSYIAKPAVVRYAEDINGENVDCDLPDYMHIDILKHAVDLYRIAVSGSLHAAQQQDENQQRENMRNNYRNEGTQQRQ